MNVYNAIMQAASHIERHPQEFNYASVEVPTAKHCGTPGCALGWIASFSPLELSEELYSSPKKRYYGIGRTACNVLKISGSQEFYQRMNQFGDGWTRDAKVCAASLRAYANVYHGDGKPATKSDAALVADLMTRVMGAKIPETANPLELVS